MQQLQLREEMTLLIYDLIGAINNQEILDLLAKLREIGHKELSLDLDAAINAYASTAIDRAFVTGYQCGKTPELMIFKQGQHEKTATPT